ncbi:catalase family protein [Schlesneria paludicola]|uniref:catalase family protein n=1 Tax=Schlesneria paludicola TaxID=360056 RepID=UPI00029A285E|nr:catalase family protein [Schlesneria paludicola]
MDKSPLAPIPYAESIETIPSDEADNITQAVQRLESILCGNQTGRKEIHGQIHAKTHAHAQAEFRILSNLPPELSQGLFSCERAYRAEVRFSNSATQPQADYIPDGRGIAIKVLEVYGPRAVAGADVRWSQDFLMVNHPSFFASDIREFLRLEEILTEESDSTLKKLQKAVTGGDWNPLNWHWRTASTAFQNASHLPMHPASYTYFSMAPIRFGAYVAKYRVKPSGDLSASVIDIVSKLGQQADAMRLMLEETLANQQILFEFQVQLRTSSETMPVEDASVEWPESQSPYRTVALLVIPRQDVRIQSETKNPRPHTFSVWNALEDHRPLGGINRLRRAVYPRSAAQRSSETSMQTDR